jgi:hypothetical protein
MITKIGDYAGKTLAWLRYELQGAFASNEKALVEIREPIMYRYDDSEPGTILEQNPKPGASIFEDKVTYIDLVVSKGPKGKEVIAENYIGKQYVDVLTKLSVSNIMVSTERETEKNKYREGIVVEQDPLEGKEIPYNTILKLKVNEVKKGLSEDEVFGIYEYIMERYTVPVDLKIVATYKNEKQMLFSLKMEGGKISIPYVLKKGTEITVILFEDKEMEKFVVEDDN